MLKEIYEQPNVIKILIEVDFIPIQESIQMAGIEDNLRNFTSRTNIIIACERRGMLV
jgi:hypothetical protein